MRTPAVALLMLISFGAAQASLAAETLTIPIRVPISPDLKVPNKVLAECDLERKLSKYLASETKSHQRKIVMKPTVSAQTPGYALDVTIVDLVGLGGGKYSGAKSVTVDGKYYKDGKLLGSFVARRKTIRGKRTCNMLQRDVESIAEDVGDWLKKPTMNARLGDID